MQERNICSQGITAFLWLTFTKFSSLCSKMKCGSHKIDNCYKLSLRQSVMIHPFRPSSIPAYFFRERKFKYLHLLPLLSSSILLFTLMSSEVLSYPWVFFDIPPCSLILAAWLLPWFIVQSMRQSAHLSARKSKGKKWINTFLFM